MYLQAVASLFRIFTVTGVSPLNSMLAKFRLYSLALVFKTRPIRNRKEGLSGWRSISTTLGPCSHCLVTPPNIACKSRSRRLVIGFDGGTTTANDATPAARPQRL